MHTFVLQDWVTIRLGGAVTTVAQDARDYLDLEAYESYVAWFEARQVDPGGGSSVQLWLETSPTKEDTFFTGIVTPDPTFATLQPGLQVVTNLLNAPLFNQTPLARWLRWRMVGSAGASATFRIVIAAHSTLS